MNLGVISMRYAKALLKSSVQASLEEAVYADMQTLSQSYLQVPELRFTIDNPMLPKEEKEKLLLTACGKTPTEQTQRFIRLVLDEDRENALQFMANSYIALYRKQRNITNGKLITAAAVSPDVEQKMRQMVEQNTKGVVEFQTEVNPDIIGGFILEYDTYRMDASVQSKLRSILTQLKK